MNKDINIKTRGLKEYQTKFEKLEYREYIIEYMLFSLEKQHADQKHDFIKHEMKYYLIGLRSYKTMLIKSRGVFPEDFIKTWITDGHIEDEAGHMKVVADKHEWDKLIDIMKTNDEFRDFFHYKEHYINSVYIASVEKIEKSKTKYNPLTTKLKDSFHISINFKYISTEVDLTVSNLKQAI